MGRIGERSFVLAIAVMGLLCLAMAVSPLLLQLGDAQSGLERVAVEVVGKIAYTAPAGYPTSVFSSYYPAPSGQEPQPAMFVSTRLWRGHIRLLVRTVTTLSSTSPSRPI